MTPPSWSVCVFMVGEDGECRKPFPTLSFPIATSLREGPPCGALSLTQGERGWGSLPGASEGAHLLGGVLQGRALPSLFPALCESPGAPRSDPFCSSGRTGGRWAGWHSLSPLSGGGGAVRASSATCKRQTVWLKAHTGSQTRADGSSHSAGQTCG